MTKTTPFHAQFKKAEERLKKSEVWVRKAEVHLQKIEVLLKKGRPSIHVVRD